MNKAQYIAIAVAAFIFAGLYWGFDTKPINHQEVEAARALDAQATNAESLLESAEANLSAQQLEELRLLKSNIEGATEEQAKIEALKELAGWWVRNNAPEVSGLVAEDIAELENNAESWTIAGATFQIALNQLRDPAKHSLCASKAVSAFEKAISLEPENITHRVNLALIYADAPPKDNPMQAVLMLRDLEQKHPDEITVYNALARLALKTNQWEKAIERLSKAISLDPNNKNANCLLVPAYQGLEDSEKAAFYAAKCAELTQ